MKEELLRQAGREYAPRQRMLALAALAPVFLLLLPAALIRLSARLDQALRLPRLPGGRLALVKGALMAVAGWLLALWTVVVQFDLGRGTPVPLMATQRLVVEPPYTYTRNPMVLGALGLYMGIAVMRRSLSAIGLVLACGAALLVYVRRAEEKEMLARFGEEYEAYRERTPFLLPRFPDQSVDTEKSQAIKGTPYPSSPRVDRKLQAAPNNAPNRRSHVCAAGQRQRQHASDPGLPSRHSLRHGYRAHNPSMQRAPND